MATIINQVKRRQASQNTMYHALYGYYFLGFNRTKLSKIYGKTVTTISNWIEKYETEGKLHRRKNVANVYKNFGQNKRDWLVKLYKQNPLLHLDESKSLFFKKFGISISVSSISVILHEAGLTYKVIERRAIQIQMKEVLRFCEEMSSIKWSWDQLVFLDEVAVDGKDMLRKRGFGIKGQRLVYRGDFGRTKRTSLLCFIGINGLLNVYETEGTFDRNKFVDCCTRFATDSDSNIKQYPGSGSIWVMDGARIHVSDKFIYFLRSMGIIPIFLPAYSPFFNPIELFFASFKKRLSKHYNERIKMDQKDLLCEVLNTYKNKCMSNYFRKCGYLSNGTFDDSKGMTEISSEIGFD